MQEVNRDRDRMSMQIILLANLSRDRNLQLVRSLDLFLRIGMPRWLLCAFGNVTLVGSVMRF